MPIHLILLVFSLVLAVVAAFYQPTWPAHPGWLAVAILAAACPGALMSLFRKKPVVIEAEQFERDKQHHISPEFRAAICWDRTCDLNTGVGEVQHGEPHIHTLEGAHIVSDLDWIIRGVKGEFYPCKPDIFEATYEPAEASVS